ncbi:adenylosuccinate synthase [Acinetobacter pittii]|uniref:adenylosuccinate synthase n=1 Tax=Acinetobacter pittii TaxID=48296 RepID=UPI00270CBB00|nr:adenylosuccinate synthase [Acinetobacter pittii]MDO7535032.1 adenylosuccinate synthase [Acinetobacter pittii]
MSKLTHRQLCEIGARFLKRPESANGHGCHFTIIEPSCYGENPDVFGVRHGIHSHGIGTFLLEAKTSRADFIADRSKPHRLNPELGMGKYRYYICPTGLIKTEELPEKWGLIYVSEKGICKVIAGVLSAPKIKYYCQWSKKNKSHFDHGKVEENFKALAFEKRNAQNELNLLTMALARLQDPELILYMQRNYTRLEQKNFEQENQIRNLQRELKSNNFIRAVGEVGDKGAGQ